MSPLHCGLVCLPNKAQEMLEQISSLISDLLKEEMTAMMRMELHDPRSNGNPKNARGSKRSFEFSLFSCLEMFLTCFLRPNSDTFLSLLVSA